MKRAQRDPGPVGVPANVVADALQEVADLDDLPEPGPETVEFVRSHAVTIAGSSATRAVSLAGSTAGRRPEKTSPGSVVVTQMPRSWPTWWSCTPVFPSGAR